MWQPGNAEAIKQIILAETTVLGEWHHGELDVAGLLIEGRLFLLYPQQRVLMPMSRSLQQFLMEQ